MGNMHCPAEDVAQLVSVARNICPYPNYSTYPFFSKMMSTNSSVDLRDHYTAVQSSLTPKQLEDFTQGLRTTFGREGKVTHGGVGIVALSLAVLFDTLATQARGERVSHSGPIPGLFRESVRGYYPPHVYTISQYLRLVPHIANNPGRMREEAQRHMKQLVIDFQSLNNMTEESHTLLIKEDTTALNLMLGQFFAACLEHHLTRINATVEVEVPKETFGWLHPGFLGEIPPGLTFNLNCEPDAGEIAFLAEVQSENRTQEAFNRCSTTSTVPKNWLLHVAQFEWLDVMYGHALAGSGQTISDLLKHKEDFDLKANALGKWTK